MWSLSSIPYTLYALRENKFFSYFARMEVFWVITLQSQFFCFSCRRQPINNCKLAIPRRDWFGVTRFPVIIGEYSGFSRKILCPAQILPGCKTIPIETRSYQIKNFWWMFSGRRRRMHVPNGIVSIMPRPDPSLLESWTHPYLYISQFRF